MAKQALILFLLAFTGLAQMPPRTIADLQLLSNTIKAAVGFTPTNEPSGSGTNLISWWLAADYTTNSGIATLPDRGGKHAWNLTNHVAASMPSLSPSNTLSFVNTNSYLKSALYTNGQPHEIWMVLNLKSPIGTSVYLVDSTAVGAGSDQQEVYTTGANRLGMFAGAAFSASPQPAAVPIAYTFAVNGAASSIRTNNVEKNAGNAGTMVASKLTVMANAAPSGNYANGELAEIITYSATNTPTQRSNIYYYLRQHSSVCTNLGLP